MTSTGEWISGAGGHLGLWPNGLTFGAHRKRIAGVTLVDLAARGRPGWCDDHAAAL